VYPALDLVECFREVPDGEGLCGGIGAVRSGFCCVHDKRPCWHLYRQRVRWRTTRPLRYPQDIGQGLSLRAPASRW
jgi:hypothetical protein